MTSRSRISTRWSGPTRARLLAVLCTTLLSLLSPAARAAAPLCDPSGASVAAPVPVLPNATGDLEAPKGCDEGPHAATDVGKPRHDAPSAERGTDVPDRVVAKPAALPRVPSIHEPRPTAEAALRLPAHTLEPFRPPCV